jgi:CheY-like chemotaxis protein
VVVVDMMMPEMDGVELTARIRADAALQAVAVIMLTSLQSPVDPTRMRKLGFNGFMTKPLRQSQMFDLIMDAVVGRAPGGVNGAEKEAVPEAEPATAAPKARRAARILLAEDNEINQIVAAEVLMKAGYQVDIVGDGRKAVQALAAGTYDLVLMDCQMPEMDGFAATAEVRRLARPGDRRMPIVALTANAVQGDRERCLAAGMDAYLTKPLDPRTMVETLEGFLATATVEGAGGAPDDGAAIDVEAVVERCARNVETVKRVLGSFARQAPEQVRTMTERLAAGDAVSVAAVAHSLKGSAAYLSAKRLEGLARTVEELGRKGQIEGMRAEVAALAAEVQRCLNVVADTV